MTKDREETIRVQQARINTYKMSGDEKKVKLPVFKYQAKRVWELDFLRGLAILLVVFDHTMFDAGSMFGYVWKSSTSEFLQAFSSFAVNYWDGDVRRFWKPFFLFIFFFVSGLCTAFSRDNFIRSIKLVVAGLFVTGVTYVLEFNLEFGNTFILFGVVQCFACIVLIYALIEMLLLRPLKKYRWSKWVFTTICLVIGISILAINAKYNVTLDEFVYENKYVKTDGSILGLLFYAEPSSPFITADYFPLFPYAGYFFLGAGVCSILYPLRNPRIINISNDAKGRTLVLYQRRRSLLPFLDHKWHLLFTIPGRYSLIIYLVWQVVAIAVLSLISLIAIGDLVII